MRMANNWTTSQKQAIETSGCNILVSAAAGSGKTAVLVERIIRKITDPENPVSIDRMVVVTFTKAAAAEMKQRIRLELDKLIELNPSDQNLIRQQTLVNNARITTIDSFCLQLSCCSLQSSAWFSCNTVYYFSEYSLKTEFTILPFAANRLHNIALFGKRTDLCCSYIK